MKSKIMALGLILLSLTACTQEERIENAARGLSEYSCLSMEGHAPRVDTAARTTLENYLVSIQNTQEKNKLNIRLREKLTTRCGDVLTQKNINVNQLTEQLITR